MNCRIHWGEALVFFSSGVAGATTAILISWLFFDPPLPQDNEIELARAEGRREILACVMDGTVHVTTEPVTIPAGTAVSNLLVIIVREAPFLPNFYVKLESNSYLADVQVISDERMSGLIKAETVSFGANPPKWSDWSSPASITLSSNEFQIGN